MKSDSFYKFNFGISSFCLTLVATLCINPICTNAAEITINDCNGVTRAQIVLADKAERKDITIGLINKEIENKLSQIKNVLLKSGSEVVASEVNDGQAYFHNLNSGVYEICPESASTQISTVKFSTAEKGTLSTVAGAALGAAAIGGSIIAIGAGSSSSSNRNSADAGNGAVLNQNTGATSLAPSKVVAPPPTSEAARACLNGAKLNPISPFQ